MAKLALALTLGLVAVFIPAAADAQIYELIKVCMRKWQTAVACIVIEKGVEKVVEKSAEEWLSYYRKGNDKPPPAVPPKTVAPAPKNLTLDEIARNGSDFRALMKDLDSKVGTAPVNSGKDLVGVLGNRCGLVSDSVACREFKPLFKMDARGACASHFTISSCIVDTRCVWVSNACAAKP